jgi:hypothetical protein
MLIFPAMGATELFGDAAPVMAVSLFGNIPVEAMRPRGVIAPDCLAARLGNTGDPEALFRQIKTRGRTRPTERFGETNVRLVRLVLVSN